MRVDALFPAISARLVVIGVDAAVRLAAAALSKPGIGLLVVCDGRGGIAGVVSKSDLVRHLATGETADAPIAMLMTRQVASCRPEDDLYAVWEGMGATSLQNMPVVGPDAMPVGVLDIRDALQALLEQEAYQERLLARYIAGVGYQ